MASCSDVLLTLELVHHVRCIPGRQRKASAKQRTRSWNAIKILDARTRKHEFLSNTLIAFTTRLSLNFAFTVSLSNDSTSKLGMLCADWVSFYGILFIIGNFDALIMLTFICFFSSFGACVIVLSILIDIFYEVRQCFLNFEF